MSAPDHEHAHNPSAIEHGEGKLYPTSSGSAAEKPFNAHIDDGVDEVAKRGHVATDQYGEYGGRHLSALPRRKARADIRRLPSFSPHPGRPLLHFDPVAEGKLRRKIDLCIVPTVALLYLFCFIDVSDETISRLPYRSGLTSGSPPASQHR